MADSSEYPSSPDRSNGGQPPQLAVRSVGFWRRGEPMVWVAGAAIATTVLMAAALVIVVVVNGFSAIWPAALTRIRLEGGKTAMGEWVRTEANPDDGSVSVQLKTGNRDLDPARQDFHWFRRDQVEQIDYLEDACVFERVEHGTFYGFLRDVKTPNVFVAPGKNVEVRLTESLAAVSRRHRDEIRPIERSVERVAEELHQLDSSLRHWNRFLASAPSDSHEDIAARIRALESRRNELKRESDELRAAQDKKTAALRQNVVVIADASGREATVALADVVRAYWPNSMGIFGKLGHCAAKLGELLWENPRESNTEGGLFPAIFGTVMLVFLMALTCFPLGVIAGIYLGEYAKNGPFVQLVRIAVNNLAGIPSIVYGIFGLGFFVYGIGGWIDRQFFSDSPDPVFGTGGLLWASLTLGLLTIPVVIVSTEEAIRTIPRQIHESSLAMGATRFQTLMRVLLPMASPGIMTGFILAMARAAGEVAPLMITGVVKLAPSLAMDGSFPFFHPDRKFMHLGFHIYDIGFQSPNVEAAKPMVYMTTLLLVLIVLLMTSTAIFLRNRMRRRYQTRSM